MDGEQRSRQRDPLPLSAGQVDAAIEGLVEHGVPRGRQAAYDLVDAGLPRDLGQRDLVVGAFDRAEHHVVGHRQGEAQEVLHDRGDAPLPGGLIELGEVHAVDGDPARGRLVRAA